MKTITTTTLRNELKSTLDLVSHSFQKILIPRNKDQESVIIMPLSEYNSMVETTYLLSTESNRRRLAESLQQAENGEVSEFEF